MRRTIGIAATALALALALAASAGPARAQPEGEGGAGAGAGPAGAGASGGHRFGLGLIIGGPTGLTGKYYLSEKVAIDFAAGFYYGWHNDHGLGAHVDLLWHPVELASGGSVDVPLYLGLGARVVDGDGNNGIDLAVRGPLGIALELNEFPLDFFFELALIVEIVDDSGRVGLDGALGLRYWF